MSRLFSTLRSRLILMVVITSIPGIVLHWQTGLYQRRQAIDAAANEVAHLASVATNTQAVMVDNVKSFLITLAHLPTLRQRDMQGCQEIVSHLFEDHFQYYASFYVADLQGNILCSPPGRHVPPDFNTCDHYRQLVTADDFVLSGYHVCRHTGKAVFSIGYPIRDMRDQVGLVANVSLDLTWFNDFATGTHLPEGSELLVVDESGVILSHYPENNRWRGFSLPESSILASLFAQKEGTLIGRGLNGEESIFSISTMGTPDDPIYVILGRPTRLAFAQANLILGRNLAVLVVLTLGLVGLIYFLGDLLIVKQARALVSATQRLAGGDLRARSGLPYDRGELGQLAQAFDRMADELAQRETERDRHLAELAAYTRSLEHANQELRDFTGIASHDLQEPLRKVQIFGEMLDERYRTKIDERGRELIARMRDSAGRMQNLVHELLAYSQVTGGNGHFQPVDLTALVRRVLSDLDWKIESTQARIEVDDLPVIEANPILMGQLFHNLIGNALKFHQANRPPVVRIRSARTEDPIPRLEIRVEDEGIGFDPKFSERIFQPFERLNNGPEYQGTGMGLTICRKIVDMHGGTISASGTPGAGAVFTVRLPFTQNIQEQAHHE